MVMPNTESYAGVYLDVAQAQIILKEKGGLAGLQDKFKDVRIGMVAQEEISAKIVRMDFSGRALNRVFLCVCTVIGRTF